MKVFAIAAPHHHFSSRELYNQKVLTFDHQVVANCQKLFKLVVGGFEVILTIEGKIPIALTRFTVCVAFCELTF